MRKIFAALLACFLQASIAHAGNILTIGIGAAPNDNTGDPLRTAYMKIMTAVNGLGSCFNGPSAPSALMPYQCWFDTSTMPTTLRYYDGTQWVAAGTLDQSTHVFNSILTGPLALSSTLAVTGGTTLNSTLGVTGASTLSSTLAVAGGVALSSTLAVTGGTTLNSTLGVTGASTLSSTLAVAGGVTLSSTLAVTGGTTLNSTLAAKGIINAGTESVLDYINVYGYGAGAWITSQGDANGVAATFATRTKNWLGGAAAPIGAIHWGFADMPTASGSPPVWAQYSEMRKYPGTSGLTQVNEQDVTNFVTGIVAFDTYRTFGTGAQFAANQVLSSGGGCAPTCYNPLTGLSNLTPTSAQLALAILNNGADYQGAINIAYNALHGVDGKTLGAFAPAISMATGHTIDWESCTNTTAYPSNCATAHVTGRISAQQDTASAILEEMIFYDSAVTFQTATNTEFGVNFNVSDTEGLTVTGDSAGNTPTLSAIGSPSDINVGLQTKGTGTVAINGSHGLTCSGTPTSSFASTLGIVTHC